jgi:hypothetical protein
MKKLRLVALAVALAGNLSASPIDVLGHLSLSDFNANIAPQTYKDWGNEPFVAVNPTNTSEIVVSGFAYSFSGTTGSGSLWVSEDGGNSWATRFPLSPVPPLSSPPASSTGPTGPNDQVFIYDSTGTLHSAMLTSYFNSSTGVDTALSVYHGTTTNPNGTRTFTWSANPVSVGATGTQADQPWMTVSGSNVFVSYDVFASTTSVRVNQSANNGSTFTRDLPVSNGYTGNSVNPGMRLASDSAGRAYAIWGVGSGNSNGVENLTYHLNRYTSGNAWDFTSNSTSDGAGGLVIDSGSSAQINASTSAGFFGTKNDLRGNITAIATDATGAHVYIVYGKRDGTSVDRLFLGEYDTNPVTGALTQRAGTGLTPFSIAGERSALPSIAVSANGTIGVLYDTSPSADNFEVHFAMSIDLGVTFTDQLLDTFNTSGFVLGSSAFPDTRRILGDYQFLTAVGDTFYGVFPGTGNVNAGGINTTGMISPLFFTISVPEPGSALLLGLGLPLVWMLRRRRA